MSLEKIRELLSKQRLVEEIVHKQNQPRQDVVENLVRRQHLTELETLLLKTPAAEIAALLESLSIEEARLLWSRLPAARENDVLWELPDGLSEQLGGPRQAEASESQMSAFELVDGRLRQIAVTRRKDLDGVNPIWIDLLGTSKSERSYIGQHFGLKLPDSGDDIELTVHSRFHLEESGETKLLSYFLLDREGDSRSVPVAFILHNGILFSVRDEELPVFRLQRRRARARQGYVADCYDILLDLFGADVEYAADSLEEVYLKLNKIGKLVLRQNMSDQEAAVILAEVAEEEDLNGRIRNNILDTQRALMFLMQNKMLSKEQVNDARQILRNIESLNSHTAFLFEKINFLLDATIGFININQNRRINQLTKFGLIFMPLNILAGIGGMSEFTMMTEGIPWPIAYSSFVTAMVMIGWGTYLALRYYEGREIATKRVKAGAGGEVR